MPRKDQTTKASLTVVIPTRRRPALLPNAVASVIGQAPGRVTVIVSDNSDDVGDREAVAAFVKRQDPAVVKYFEAPSLPMTAHWEWALQRALAQHASTHVTFLTDRMVFRPHFLEELLAIADRYPEDMVSYNYDKVEDTTLPAHLELERWSGRLLAINAARMLECASRGVYSNALPRMMNAVVPRRLLDAVRRRFGSVFASISPDVCFAFRSLAVSDRLLYYDKAGLIQYAIAHSQGINYQRGIAAPEVTEFARLLGGDTLNLAAAPVPQFQTMINSAYHEYAFVRAEAHSDKLPEIDRSDYLGAIAWSALTMWDRRRAAVVQAQLRAQGWTPLNTLAWFGRKMAATLVHDPGRLLEVVRNRVAPKRRFASSAEAIAWAIAHPRRRSAGLAHQWQLRPTIIAENDDHDGNAAEEALLTA